MLQEDRRRHRQGTVRLVRAIPYANRETTLSLLPGGAVGEWLADHRSLVTGRLLDAGCGNRPYAAWYEPLAGETVAFDAAPAEGIDLVGFVDRIPLAPGRFDTVLCTEVLEHATDAEQAAAELFRVLRPGGHALITIPYLYPTHEAPYDFRRFTHFGLRDLLERHGFEVLSVQAKGGIGVLIAHFFILALTNAIDAVAAKLGRKRPLTDNRVVRAIFWIPQELRLRLRSIPREIRGSATRTSLGYMAIARRPLDTEP